MNGTLDYAAPAGDSEETIYGLASNLMAGLVAAVPMLIMLACHLLERSCGRRGFHPGYMFIANLLMAMPSVATVALSVVGIMVAAAGIRKNDNKQWLSPLGITTNLAGLFAGILSIT